MTRPTGAALLQPLRDLGPEMDTFAMIPPVALSRIHMDPEGPTPAIGGGGRMLGELTDETIDAFVAAAGPGSDSALLMAELRHLGGALSRAPEGHGALARLRRRVHRCSRVGIPVTPEIAAAIHVGLATLGDALAPWDAGSAYLNFTEETGRPGAVLLRPRPTRGCAASRPRSTPDGLFRGNHAIERLSSTGRPQPPQ